MATEKTPLLSKRADMIKLVQEEEVIPLFKEVDMNLYTYILFKIKESLQLEKQLEIELGIKLKSIVEIYTKNGEWFSCLYKEDNVYVVNEDTGNEIKFSVKFLQLLDIACIDVSFLYFSNKYDKILRKNGILFGSQDDIPMM